MLSSSEATSLAQLAQHRFAFAGIESVLGQLVDPGYAVNAAQIGYIAQYVQRYDFVEKIALMPQREEGYDAVGAPVRYIGDD